MCIRDSCNAICPGTVQSPSLDARIAAQAKSLGKTEAEVRQMFIDRQPMGRLGTAEEIAAIGQFAENVYFGKPCGLMDQTASAVGGIVTIDFRDPGKPEIRQLKRSFGEFGLQVLVIHTGGSHADLAPEYAAVPAEMKAVAQALGGTVCRDIADEQALVAAK